MLSQNIFANYEIQDKEFQRYLGRCSKLRIGTLGPKGTTSYYALQYMLRGISQFKHIQVEIILRDNFNLVHQDLLEGQIDIAIIPNAYEHITEMYWNIKLKHIFSFLLQTPQYGLASTKEKRYASYNGVVKISSCSPVFCLLDQFVEQLGDRISKYELIRAESTIHAAQMVSSGKADLAITNETSLQEENLVFISDCFKADVIWSIFVEKHSYETTIHKENEVI